MNFPAGYFFCNKIRRHCLQKYICQNCVTWKRCEKLGPVKYQFVFESKHRNLNAFTLEDTENMLNYQTSKGFIKNMLFENRLRLFIMSCKRRRFFMYTAIIVTTICDKV